MFSTERGVQLAIAAKILAKSEGRKRLFQGTLPGEPASEFDMGNVGSTTEVFIMNSRMAISFLLAFLSFSIGCSGVRHGQSRLDYTNDPTAVQTAEDLEWNDIKKAFTTASFEAYLSQYPDGKYRKQALGGIAEIKERQIINDININGIGDRFIIRHVKSTSNNTSIVRFSIIGDVLNPEILYITTDYPSDEYYMTFDSHSGNTQHNFGGEGSIQRYEGTVKLGGDTYIGERDISNRLTFYLTDEGYIYIRGNGKVILQNGEEHVFDKSK